LRSQVRCTQCGYKSNTYDPFLDISLEVSKKSSNSIAAAIADFTRKETLDIRNQWKCGGCHKPVCATKQLTIFRPPLTLCVQLKRFSYGGGYRGGGSKITKPIQYPASLSLPLSDKRNCEYDLTGVIIHIGGSASSGHYTAFVKRPDAGGKGQWFHMDDSSCSPVSLKSVLRERDAYVLFYCRREVRVEYPKPPARSFTSAEEAAEAGKARAKAKAKTSPQQASVESETANPKQTCKCNLPQSGRAEESIQQKASPSSSSKSSSSSSSSSEESVSQDNGKSETPSPAKPPPEEASFPSQSESPRNESSSTSPGVSPTKGRSIPGKLVFDRGPQIGQVEVVTGKKGKAKLKLKDALAANNDSLFGARSVGKWDDDGHDTQTTSAVSSKMKVQRSSALSLLNARDREQKKYMRLDRWDAALDEGKVRFAALDWYKAVYCFKLNILYPSQSVRFTSPQRKKVKEKKEPLSVVPPKHNPFQKAQKQMQQSAGVAKGHASWMDRGTKGDKATARPPFKKKFNAKHKNQGKNGFQKKKWKN
jgi:hypothetical protein